MDKNGLKILGFEFLVDLIYIIIILSSYMLTVNILSDSSNTNAELDFMRGAFVFIAPCALEAFGLLTSQEKDDKYQDGIEVFLSVIGILDTVIIAVVLLFDKIGYIQLFKLLIAVYPIKVISNGIFDFLHLFKERNISV